MEAKTIVITGASDGIGKEAAKILKKHGHNVILVGRNVRKTEEVAKSLSADFFVSDYSKLSNVYTLANNLLSKLSNIDVLINNAGGVSDIASKTEDGFDEVIQVNYLAPFLLTQLLLPMLQNDQASIINTASEGHRLFGQLDLIDLYNGVTHTPEKSYGDSKIALILFSSELQKRYGENGLPSMSFCPGVVHSNFASKSPSFRSMMSMFPSISAQVGAKPLIHFAEGSPGVSWEKGAYYDRLTLTKPSKQVQNLQLQTDLWTLTELMLKL
ncbi:SDR family NAD(P)-dependent oxidoreductase [Vibrio sp. DW001]|uniref:SDR family NAD(P)-dependent oxidoreductase n=1 Tax=Vibrio sp. DW001 TaxID=2912315 RepID=UPI0023B1D82B|nr:SDR family NAD(P)-dependent oxidoreductase [Vibrio sp. DW001]WED25213.1 SDR family NAD(P)-dependent oxidoreductase [Vibrio sp. DW001]